MEKVLFKEEQRFSQWWIWLLLSASFGVATAFLLLLLHESERNSEDYLILLVVLIVAAIVVLVLFVRMRLVIEIRDAGVRFKYPPLINKWREIGKNEIERFEVRKYKPIVEYGGWGIKTGRLKRGKAYSVSGNIGLQLYLKNGKKLLLGTQKKQAIKSTMNKLLVDAQFVHKGGFTTPKEKKFQLHSKTKKILIIVLIELVAGLVIFSIIQILK